MSKQINKIITVLLLFVYTTCLAQAGVEPALINYKKSSYYDNNYNGPIKSSYWYYTYIDNDFVEMQFHKNKEGVRDQLMYNNSDVMGGAVYKEFDKYGNQTKVISKNNKTWFGKSEHNVKGQSNYTYDEQDWKEKKEIKVVKFQPYPVYDYEITVKLNYKSQKGNSKNIIESRWTYVLDDQQRVMKGINYRSVETDYNEVQGLDENAIKSIEDEFAKRYSVPFIEATYNYDARGNVNRLNIQTKQQRPIPFHFLDTETGFCPDLHASYEYDSKNRMTQVTYNGCNDTLAFEKYIYEQKKGYVSKRTRYIKSGRRSWTHLTNTMIFYHNENGDIIQKEYEHEVTPSHMRFPKSIYYSYEYDKYNNWVKCYIYMEGKPEDSEPTAIAQRDLEYYDN